jgi:divalent metal cation (Fe/Co/Zn/Cd) transporter
MVGEPLNDYEDAYASQIGRDLTDHRDCAVGSSVTAGKMNAHAHNSRSAKTIGSPLRGTRVFKRSLLVLAVTVTFGGAVVLDHAPDPVFGVAIVAVVVATGVLLVMGLAASLYGRALARRSRSLDEQYMALLRKCDAFGRGEPATELGGQLQRLVGELRHILFALSVSDGRPIKPVKMHWDETAKPGD